MEVIVITILGIILCFTLIASIMFIIAVKAFLDNDAIETMEITISGLGMKINKTVEDKKSIESIDDVSE